MTALNAFDSQHLRLRPAAMYESGAQPEVEDYIFTRQAIQVIAIRGLIMPGVREVDVYVRGIAEPFRGGMPEAMLSV